MRTNIKILQDGAWVTYNLYNSVAFDERRDEQFDTGSVQLISTSKIPFDDYCAVRMNTTDDLEVKTSYFVGFDSVEKRGGGYFIHTLELAEPTRLLMGILIDGRKVTQPIEGSGETKKSLYEVLQGLLNTFETLSYNQVNASGRPRSRMRIVTEYDYNNLLSTTKNLMENTTSPEFHWEAETSLWECLCDIGNVINAIPRLTYNEYNAEYPFSLLVFDMINDVTGEYEL